MTETLSTGPACARPGCGRALPKAATGRPALHCSPACRQAEHRRRRLEEELPALRDEARALLALLGGDEHAQRALEGLDGGQVPVFVRHARTAQAALDGAFALLGLPAPTFDQAARGQQGEPAPAGRGKRAQVHGQQAVPEALLTAFQNTCRPGTDKTTAEADAPVPDGGHGHGESPDRGRAPAVEPVRVRAVLPPDTRPLPTTTAYDELLPSRRRRAPGAPDRPADNTPGKDREQTTTATTGAKPDPSGNDRTAGAQHTATAAGARLTVVFDDGTPHTHPEPAVAPPHRPERPVPGQTGAATPPGPSPEQDDTAPATTETEPAALPGPGQTGTAPPHGNGAQRPDAPVAEPESGPNYDGGTQRQTNPAPGRGRDDDALAAAGDGPVADGGRADTTVVPAPTPDSHDTFTAAETELAAAARALIGDPTSGLSKAVDRQLYRHTTALVRGEDMLLPHLRYATADLASRRGRLRLPDTPQGQRLHTALTAYENTWNTTRTGTATAPGTAP
ncbi:hypothetical protein ACWDD9_20625 [Kitasatospora sp. NPDC001119]